MKKVFNFIWNILLNFIILYGFLFLLNYLGFVEIRVNIFYFIIPFLIIGIIKYLINKYNKNIKIGFNNLKKYIESINYNFITILLILITISLFLFIIFIYFKPEYFGYLGFKGLLILELIITILFFIRINSKEFKYNTIKHNLYFVPFFGMIIYTIFVVYIIKDEQTTADIKDKMLYYLNIYNTYIYPFIFAMYGALLGIVGSGVMKYELNKDIQKIENIEDKELEKEKENLKYSKNNSYILLFFMIFTLSVTIFFSCLINNFGNLKKEHPLTVESYEPYYSNQSIIMKSITGALTSQDNKLDTIINQNKKLEDISKKMPMK